MIEMKNFIDVKNVALWCGAGADATDLARAADGAIANKLKMISVAPDAVGIVWPWLENKRIKIFARLYLEYDDADGISEIAEKINSVFKSGADGVQVFVNLESLSSFVSQLYLIRDDLFFNKDLIIGLDISTVEPCDWAGVFSELKKIRATGLMLALTRDTGNKSDFIGRVYAALNAWGDDYAGGLQFAFGLSQERMEQIMRLVQSVRPKLWSKTAFFVNDN